MATMADLQNQVRKLTARAEAAEVREARASAEHAALWDRVLAHATPAWAKRGGTLDDTAAEFVDHLAAQVEAAGGSFDPPPENRPAPWSPHAMTPPATPPATPTGGEGS